MRATLVASRPRTISVASITNQLAPTLRASASLPLATYVLIETVTPFPVETNVNLRVCAGYCQRNVQRCRCKMRMSGLSKVEMSGFMGGRGAHGNGADYLEPTRTGPAAGATRDPGEAHQSDRSGPAAEDQRSAHPSVADTSSEVR